MTQELIVDSREDEKIVKLIEKEQIPYKIQALICGDYTFTGSNTIFERKTSSDFYNSAISGHLSEQCKTAIANGCEHFIIVLIGDYEDLFWGGVRANQEIFYGMLASIIAKYKFSVLHFKRETQFISFLKRCLNKLDGEIDFTKIKRLSSKENVELSLLCALPSMSLTKANRILEKYNVKLVLADKDGKRIEKDKLINTFKEIDGIGLTIANALNSYFD